jgi:hypothetical protein
VYTPLGFYALCEGLSQAVSAQLRPALRGPCAGGSLKDWTNERSLFQSQMPPFSLLLVKTLKVAIIII